MKLIAKKGTAFEQTVKEMCEKMTEGIIGARDMVEKAVGVGYQRTPTISSIGEPYQS